MSEQEQQDAKLLGQIRAALDDADAQLDPETKLRLQQARQAAVAQVHKRRRTWQPLAGLALAASVSLLVIGLVMLQTGPDDMMQQSDDLSLLSAGEDLEFYENLEFYQWLALTERRS